MLAIAFAVALAATAAEKPKGAWITVEEPIPRYVSAKEMRLFKMYIKFCAELRDANVMSPELNLAYAVVVEFGDYRKEKMQFNCENDRELHNRIDRSVQGTVKDTQ